MRSFSTSVNSETCLTRVMLDGQSGIELSQLQAVMARIHAAVARCIPAGEQAHVDRALLHLAINAMVGANGSEQTADVLIRLIDAVLEDGVASDATPLHSLPACNGSSG